MPSPLGEGQADKPINRHHLGEVHPIRDRFSFKHISYLARILLFYKSSNYARRTSEVRERGFVWNMKIYWLLYKFRPKGQ